MAYDALSIFSLYVTLNHSGGTIHPCCFLCLAKTPRSWGHRLGPNWHRHCHLDAGLCPGNCRYQPGYQDFFGKSQYIGIVFAPYLWLVFAVDYTSQGKLWNARLVAWLTLLPLTTLALALTTEWHGLIWRETFIKQVDGLTVLGVSYGSWFWLHFVYSYLFLLAGTVIFLRTLRRMQGLYRAQIVILVLAILAPWLGNALYFLGLSPLPTLDLTPFAFTITITMFAWAIFGYRMGDISPIARELVVKAMRESR